MGTYDGGRLIAEVLDREKVEVVFSVSGGVLNPLYRGLEELGIRVVHTRHEAAASFMADGWARTTGRPGVVATTLGPGVTNTVTGVFTAHRGTSPVIVLAGQSGQATTDLEAGMAINPIPIMASITKWAKTVGDVSRIPEYVSGAFRMALTGRPGPVFLEFPSNVLRSETTSSELVFPDPQTSRGCFRSYPDPASIDAAMVLLGEATRPLLLAGSGVWWSGASEELARFVERVEMPFFLARAGRGSVPEDHPLCFGPGYLAANPVLEAAFEHTDLVVLVGHRLDFDLAFGHPPRLNRNARIIQIDIEPSEIGRYKPTEVGIVADARTALRSLTDKVGGTINIDPTWLADLEKARQDWHDEMNQQASSAAKPMHPLRFLKELADSLPKEAIWVTSHGNIDFWADAYLQISQPGGYLRAGQSGSLGAEVPYGVAAKLAHPERPVVVVVGDGGFGYHCMELDTASRYGAPLLVAIGNDASWGAIALPQVREYGRSYSTGLEFRNYERIADVLGGHGEFADTPESIGPAVRRALSSGLPAVLNVPISSDESRYMRLFSS